MTLAHRPGQAFSRVDLELSERAHRLRRRTSGFGAWSAQYGLDSGNELTHAEWFGEIVIGPHRQSHQAIHLLGTRGGDQHVAIGERADDHRAFRGGGSPGGTDWKST